MQSHSSIGVRALYQPSQADHGGDNQLYTLMLPQSARGISRVFPLELI
jgi:hypothetical protein